MKPSATCEDPRVSIIVPCQGIDRYTRECVEHCKRLDYGNHEIILLPDAASERVDGVKIVPTGSVTPGAKRNVGATNSDGEVCAFIDSDAYPSKDWLRNAIKYFGDPSVAGVGGPGLSPVEDSVMQRAGGHVLSSFMVGNLSSRFRAREGLESDEIHSCNFIVWRSVLEEVGGWSERYWPGEDTLICLAMKRAGKRLIEAPDVVVYHHRRPLFLQHLKQVSRFGLHRGFFARKFRGNSFKPTYFMPSSFIIFLLTGTFASLVNPLFVQLMLFAVILYFMMGLIAAWLEVKKRDVGLILLVWLGIIATHITYGLFFIRGFLKRELSR